METYNNNSGDAIAAKQVKAFGTEAAEAPLNQLNIKRENQRHMT